MGKKIFNAKARQNRKAIIDNSVLKDIKIDLEVLNANSTSYDEANALVLPSKKRVTQSKEERKQGIKILSKKQRKRLQTIVDKKKKKGERCELLEALANVQVPATELNQYTSISQVQTIGVKKLSILDKLLTKKSQGQQQAQLPNKLKSLKGATKRKLLIGTHSKLETKRKNPNYVGLEDDDDTESVCVEAEEKKDQIGEDAKCATEDIPRNNEKKGSETKLYEDTNKSAESKMNREEVEKTKVVASRPAVFVPVHRDSKIQAARLKLPILAEEQQIMELINENNIIIVVGETGSGKTTQIPQFLYEAGYTKHGQMIGVTEPRRVAAIAMSTRIAKEMNLSEKKVSYLIRFEGNVTPETEIKFMTDGVLLKEIESDFLLKKYSVIILDEAHERSAYTDILIGLLSRIVPLRLKRGSTPLKLIIMSATLRVEDFISNTKLFRNPPALLKVETRQYPVTVHFQKHTPTNYIEEAFRKTVKVHTKLPEGGVLIFVTGQQEVRQLVRKLKRTFPYKRNEEDVRKELKDEKLEENVPEEEFDMKHAIRSVRKSKKKFLNHLALPKINLDDFKLPGDDTEADLLENPQSDQNDELELDNEEDNGLPFLDGKSSITKEPLFVLPLYSLLSAEKQNRIFQPPPEGCRLCVVATNVAETSLTIPNIKYVIDTGRQKTRWYDKITGVSAFVVTFTSKASADQRAGRAGRVNAGHCYRLYSSAVYKDEFTDFSIPDIQQKPVDDLMLQMRCMGIDRVINFPFPSPPDEVQLKAAERRLIILGALESLPKPVYSTLAKDLPPKITRLGRVISHFPVAPRFGKMLALSHQKNLLPYTVCLVAALSVQEVLLEINPENFADFPITSNKWKKKRLSWAPTGNYQLLGDLMVLLRGVGAAEYAGCKGELSRFCSDNGLRLKAITEIRKLRIQLTNEINLNIADIDLCVDPAMPPPTDSQARFLRQILLAGMGDRVARKIPLNDISDKDERHRLKYAYNCLDMEEPVFMHSSSVLKSKLPDWIIYQEAYETLNADSTKIFIRGITAIEPEWLLIYVPLLCNVKAIREDPLPRYKAEEGKIYCFVDATYGKSAWELPLTEMEMPISERAFCYFAMFFLDGQVCSRLSAYKAKLKFTPSAIIKSWSNLNQSIVRFKLAFSNKQINTRQKLKEEWQENPNFLLEEYHNVLYDVSLYELISIWPPA
uniref:RNA helicase n=1 Tax=Glossina palpalis gambiensis TaxID=67801 RepID=A0A1B0BKE3_9MUSC